MAHGARKPGRKDTLHEVLEAPDRGALLDWLRHQPMALHRRRSGDLLMVHAGVLPQWSVADTLAAGRRTRSGAARAALAEFLQTMYGNEPAQWNDALSGSAPAAGDRQRADAAALLQRRRRDGVRQQGRRGGAPAGFMPWFDVPGRATAVATVAFGHWSTLGWKSRPDLLSTDTGCVWGGCLSAVRIGPTLQDRELIQVACPQSQKPG